MLKRTILISVAVLFAASFTIARAADVNNAYALAPLPAKAPAFNDPCQLPTATTPLSCSGLYVGAGISGQGTNADIIGNGINGSVFAGGMTPTIDAGYLYAKGNWVFGAEFDAGYALGSNTGGSTNINGFHFMELAMVGGNLSALLGTQQPITIPPQLANAVIAPYVAVGQAQWQLAGAWANGTVGGAGVWFDIGPRWIGNLRYTYTNFSGARTLGLKINDDQALFAGVAYKF